MQITWSALNSRLASPVQVVYMKFLKVYNLPWEESPTLPARILFPFLCDQNGVVWEVVGDDELSVCVNLPLHHQASAKPKDVTVKALPEKM